MAGGYPIAVDQVPKGNNGILIALNHNKREFANRRVPANIDATKIPLNYSLAGNDTAQNLATEAKIMMLKAGITKTAKNTVMAIEVLFTLPANRNNQDNRPFFKDCFEWVKGAIDGELLSFDVHRDEGAEHAHAIIVPIRNGKMDGSKIIGGTGDLMRRNRDFYDKVGAKHGLSRNKKTKLSEVDKASLIQALKKRLANDSVMKSELWPLVRDDIKKEPLRLAKFLGVKVNPTTDKSFAGIMTSTGKGAKIETSKPI